LAELWGELGTYKRIGTYVRHLCENGLVIPGEAVDDESMDAVPRPLARLLPRMLDSALGLWPPTGGGARVPQRPTDGDLGGDVRMADPYHFVATVLQVLLSLGETPTPLRIPQPRPILEAELPGLAGWGYDPEELQRASQEGRLRRGYDLPLTVPPPALVLPDDALERLAPLAEGEEQLNFVVLLLLAAGILQPGSPVTPWPPAQEAFLQRDPLRQRGVLARTYFRMTNWSELWRMLRSEAFPFRLRRDARSGYWTMDHLCSKLSTLRWLLLRVLGSFPDDTWVAMEDLDHLLRVLWPTFERSAWVDFQRPAFGSRPHLSEPGSEADLDYEKDGVWGMVQGRFVRGMISGPLHWLGLADLRFDDQRLRHVRFHGLADLYWDRGEAPPASPHLATAAVRETEAGAFRAEGLLLVVRPSALGGRGHELMSTIARLQTAVPNRFEYRLEGGACLEAFEAGMTLSDIVGAWEDQLPIPIPESILAQLTEWWDGYGRLRLYEDLTVIELGDEYALAEMKAITSLDEYLVAEVSPRLVVIPPEAVDHLVQELRAAGHTPQTVAGVDPAEEAW